MRLVTYAAVVCLGLTGPVLAQDKADIQKLQDQFSEAFNAGNAAALTDMYAQDAWVLPPGAEMMQGHDKIRDFWEKDVQQAGDLKITVIDVKPLGENAVRAIATVTGKTKGDQPQDFTIKNVTIFEKAGDDWKIESDIWNMNQ